MLNNKIKIFAILGSSIVIGLTIILILNLFDNKKIVYVDNQRLFDGFAMTKEMKVIGEREYNLRKTEIDSLYSRLQYVEENEEREFLMKEFISKRESLEQFNEEFGYTESEKIWSRIKNYTKEFTNNREYKFIITSENSRNVLYADPELDITDELLLFINSKYEGNK